MTEFEYAKAARGTAAVVDDEYAWGTTTIVQADGVANPNEATEIATTAANADYGNHAFLPGPIRNGGLSSGSETREEGLDARWLRQSIAAKGLLAAENR